MNVSRKMRAWAETADPTSLGHFLVADDHEPLVRSLCRALRVYRPCLPASTLREAHDHVQAGHRIIGAIIDIRFPEGSGFDLLEHMRRVRGWRGPALIISGDLQPSDVARAFDLGARALHKEDAPTRLDPFARECLVRAQVGHAALARAIECIVQRYQLGALETEVLMAAVMGQSARTFCDDRNLSMGTYRSRSHKLLELSKADSVNALVREVFFEALEESAEQLAV